MLVVKQGFTLVERGDTPEYRWIFPRLLVSELIMR